jgi:hypothetical protein
MRHAKSQKELEMNPKLKHVAGAILIVVCGNAGAAQSAPERKQGQQAVTQGNFYCNTKVMNPSERARHKVLTDKLVVQRTQIVETERGYEFQYSPFTVSLAELGEWVAAESKCCPFFDFHIDLENEGKLLCLRLTGAKGIKEFIRTEFHVSPTI